MRHCATRKFPIETYHAREIIIFFYFCFAFFISVPITGKPKKIITKAIIKSLKTPEDVKKKKKKVT